jgi:hypothetical protein
MKRSTTIAFLLVAVLSAGCSSGVKRGSPPTTTAPSPPISSTTNWDAGAVQSLVNVARSIGHAFTGQCSDLGLLPRDSFLFSAQKLGLRPPLAVSDCSGFGGQVELSAFASAASRDQYDNARTLALCRRSIEANDPIDGLHWVTMAKVSIQGTDEGSSREIAQAVGGRYEGVPCPGAVLDWEPVAETRITSLAAKLRATKNLSCDNFLLLDRQVYARNPQYANRLPAAYARCNGPAGAVFWLAAFSPKSVSRDKFVTGETRLLCSSQPGVVAVKGNDWALLTTDQHVAAVAAAALEGKAGPSAC